MFFNLCCPNIIVHTQFQKESKYCF